MNRTLLTMSRRFLTIMLISLISIIQVSRLYYELTHHPVIWKRLLRRTTVPLPPAAPSERNKALTGLEAERLLVRAHSLELNWKRRNPRTLRAWSFESHFHATSMTLLPGGQYLVASVSNSSRSRYSVTLFSMDNNPPRALAAFPLETKAYDIQAKYMTIHGKPSIVFAFLQRNYHHKTDKKRAYVLLRPVRAHDS